MANSIPPEIMAIVKKNARGKKLTAAEQKKYTDWKASQDSSGKVKTYRRKAIGVPGAKVYDPNSGKAVGYTPDTYVTQKKFNAEDQASLNNAAPYLTSRDQIPVQHPRYYSGDEYRPASDMSVADRVNLQNQMDQAGLYTEGADVIKGVWGVDDIAAYNKALASANAAGVTVEEWLQHASELATTEGLDKRDPLSIKLTNPDDIRAVIQTGSKSMHNTYLSEDEIQKFISGYQNEERRAQTANYAAENPNGPGGEVVQAPNLGGLQYQTEQAARTGVHETEFKSNTFTDRLDEMLAGLRGPGGSQQVGTNL